ncbi:MAG: hypothetical protein BJ554DRAFT_6852 [Olpidium bornovanus]|uniref:Protein kinase domain-containing protein n=1 Tax=Olpidium bornovanus TaxID=278681 RepID=A0A8H7ZX12_9FUNG|nr:MAG: hypothetical protein BJ554DRAFT_6852 [Olpidium bornovanus]
MKISVMACGSAISELENVSSYPRENLVPMLLSKGSVKVDVHLPHVLSHAGVKDLRKIVVVVRRRLPPGFFVTINHVTSYNTANSSEGINARRRPSTPLRAKTETKKKKILRRRWTRVGRGGGGVAARQTRSSRQAPVSDVVGAAPRGTEVSCKKHVAAVCVALRGAPEGRGFFGAIMHSLSSTKAAAASRAKVAAVPRPPDATDPLTQLRKLQQQQQQQQGLGLGLGQRAQQHLQRRLRSLRDRGSSKAPSQPRPLELLSVAGRKTVWEEPKPSGACRWVDEFEKLNEVGKGAYGVVYRARDTKDGTVVALKKVIFDQEQEGYPMTSLREIMLLSELRHENVVTVLDVVVGRNLRDFFVVMEYCEHRAAD